MDLCIRDVLIAWRSRGRNRCLHIVLHKMDLQKFHTDVAIDTKRVKDFETRLNDHVVVQDSEHKIRHAKFSAEDILSCWIAENPGGLSFFCDLTSCDLPGVPIPEFSMFCDYQKGVCGLVIKRCTKLGKLQSDCVGERGAPVGSFRSDL